MSFFQIAHLSDPHLPLAELPAWDEVRFKRLLSLLSWRLKRRHLHKAAPLARVMDDIRRTCPQLVALTGDLTNLGLRSEFRRARRWLEEQALPSILLVPGNHDALIRQNPAGKAAQWAEWLKTETSFPSLLLKDHIALIGVNTAVATPPFFASGRMGAAQGARLRALLHQTGQQGLCRVVLIHHPPVARLVSRRKGLDDLALFQTILQEAGAELVLHGHSHRATVASIPQTDIPVIGTTSASHTAGNPETTAGWNAIAAYPQGDRWNITVQRRELCPDGTMQNGAAHSFTPHRLSPPIRL